MIHKAQFSVFSVVFPRLSNFLEFFGVSMFPAGYLDFFEKTTKKMIEERIADEKVKDIFYHLFSESFIKFTV